MGSEIKPPQEFVEWESRGSFHSEITPLIQTQGDNADGILVQSTGGGGGTGGLAVQVTGGAFGAISVRWVAPVVRAATAALYPGMVLPQLPQPARMPAVCLSSLWVVVVAVVVVQFPLVLLGGLEQVRLPSALAAPVATVATAARLPPMQAATLSPAAICRKASWRSRLVAVVVKAVMWSMPAWQVVQR